MYLYLFLHVAKTPFSQFYLPIIREMPIANTIFCSLKLSLDQLVILFHSSKKSYNVSNDSTSLLYV